MRKRAFLVAAVGLVAVLVAGGLVASNMGFKNNYPLDAAGINGSATGTQSISLPYNQQTNINTAEDLINDIETVAGDPSAVSAVSRYLSASDSLEGYTGFSGTNFSIVPGEGYLVTVNSSVNYIIVGSHAPQLPINLDGPGVNGSATGTTLWSYPYHSTAANAEDLINEINTAAGASVVGAVSRYLAGSDSLEGYTGFSGTNFTLVPGESYFISVTASVGNWFPNHY